MNRRDDIGKMTGTVPYAYEADVDTPAVADVAEALTRRGDRTAVLTAGVLYVSGPAGAWSHERADALLSRSR